MENVLEHCKAGHAFNFQAAEKDISTAAPDRTCRIHQPAEAAEVCRS